MTKLTFTKNKEGTEYKTKNMIAREKIIRGLIEINYNEFNVEYTVFIVNVSTGYAISKSVCKTMSEAKTMVKNKFKELGVLFKDQVRKKVG